MFFLLTFKCTLLTFDFMSILEKFSSHFVSYNFVIIFIKLFNQFLLACLELAYSLIWGSTSRKSYRKILQEILAENSCWKILREILVGKSCRKFLWEILAGNSCGKILREILVGKSCEKILWKNLVGNSCGKFCRKYSFLKPILNRFSYMTHQIEP